jgi:FkbM family methyltransferase
MSFTDVMRRVLVGTPLEGVARTLYTRLSRSQGVRYEREILQVMRRTLRPTSNCIDVGAYRGAVLHDMLTLAPQGQHVAFEPVAHQYAYLVRKFPQVQIHQVALHDTVGQRTFYHVQSRPTYSGLQKVLYPSPNEQVEEVTVQTDCLDNRIPADRPIQLIKIDVEGAEFHVLRGGSATIRRTKPIIVFEHGLTSQWYYQIPSEQVYDLLVAECGLQVTLMRSWLDGGPGLDRQAFAACVNEKREFYFMAHP